MRDGGPALFPEVEPDAQVDRSGRVAGIIDHDGVFARLGNGVPQPPRGAGVGGRKHAMGLLVSQPLEILAAQEGHTNIGGLALRLVSGLNHGRPLPKSHIHIPPLVGGNLVNVVYEVHARGGEQKQAGSGDHGRAALPGGRRPFGSVGNGTMGTMIDSMAQPGEGLA